MIASHNDPDGRRLAQIVGELMAQGAKYEDALVAVAWQAPGVVASTRRSALDTTIDRALAKIVEKDLAPLLPLPLDDFELECLDLCEGDDEGPAYGKLVALARFEDERDVGQPFVVRDGVVARRPT